MPDGCPLGARSVPSATGSGSSTTEFVPRPTCIDPASRRIRCPAWLSAGLCPSSSKPCGIEGSRRPCPRAASRASCAGVHDGACGSERWRLRLAPKPWSRGRWRPSGSPRAGCRFGRPQRGASSPICLYPSDSLRSFGPPGAATLDESKDARSQSISSALPKRSKSLRCSHSHTPASCHSSRRRQHTSTASARCSIPYARESFYPRKAGSVSRPGRAPKALASTTGSGCRSTLRSRRASRGGSWCAAPSRHPLALRPRVPRRHPGRRDRHRSITKGSSETGGQGRPAGVQEKARALVQLTVSEVRKLLRRLVLARRPPPREEVLRWSAWRRNHQAVARRCHYKRRGVLLA